MGGTINRGTSPVAVREYSSSWEGAARRDELRHKGEPEDVEHYPLLTKLIYKSSLYIASFIFSIAGCSNTDDTKSFNLPDANAKKDVKDSGFLFSLADNVAASEKFDTSQGPETDVVLGQGEIVQEAKGTDDSATQDAICEEYKGYMDKDGDGFAGDKVCSYCYPKENPLTGCLLSPAIKGADCDDNDSALNPSSKWYLDADGDGYYDNNTTKTQCTAPEGKYSRNLDGKLKSGDCNDADFDIHLDATETCDSKDNDCNGITDRGPGMICLSTAEVKFKGSSNDHVGSDVNSGDATCDGKSDLAISAIEAGYNGKGAGAGRIYVVPGSTTFFSDGKKVVDLYKEITLPPFNGAFIEGETPHDHLGTFTIGKGKDEACSKILVGGHGSQNDQTFNTAGRAFLLDPSKKLQGKIDLAEKSAYTNKFKGIPGLPDSPQKGSHIGGAMAIGDVDGDGKVDFLLPATWDEGLYVLLGKDSAAWGSAKETELHILAKNNKILKLKSNKSFAQTVNVLGQFGGDPFSKKDVVGVGNMEYANKDGATVGALYLFLNKFDFTIKGEHNISEFQDSNNNKVIIIQGVAAAGGFGATPPIAMDDKKILVAAMYASKSYLIQGPIYGSPTFSVTDKITITEFTGVKNETTGRHTTPADINCDGYPDFLASVEGGKFVGVGGVYVFLGSKNGWPELFDFAKADLTLVGEASSGAGPMTVADLNGDGYPDIAVGGQYANNSAGMTWVLSGAEFQKQLPAGKQGMCQKP